jgi:hypothetical protein
MLRRLLNRAIRKTLVCEGWSKDCTGWAQFLATYFYGSEDGGHQETAWHCGPCHTDAQQDMTDASGMEIVHYFHGTTVWQERR